MYNGFNRFGKFYMWNSKLLSLDIVKRGNQDDLYERKLSGNNELFLNYLSEPKSENYSYNLQDTDSGDFIIKISPVHPNKKNCRYFMLTINKQDTVLTEFISQSVFNVTQIAQYKIKRTDIQITNVFIKIKIVQDEETEYYYIKNIQKMGTFNVKTADSDFNVTLQITASKVNEYPTDQKASKKKVSLYDDALFKIDFPNSPGFWKQYVNP